MQVDTIIHALKSNVEWIFSGIGVSVLAVLGCLFRSVFKHPENQKQTVDGGSSAIQVGRDVNINGNGRDD
jgi:hypothetical protein